MSQADAAQTTSLNPVLVTDSLPPDSTAASHSSQLLSQLSGLRSLPTIRPNTASLQLITEAVIVSESAATLLSLS